MGLAVRKWRFSVLPVVSAVLLAGCTSGTDTTATPTETTVLEATTTPGPAETVDAATTPTGYPTTRFLACLANADVPTWLSADDGTGTWPNGVIYVYGNADPTDQGTALTDPNAGLGIILDTEGSPTGRIGTWVAPINAASFADPTLAEAWGNCEEQNPDFAQPDVQELDELSPEELEGIAKQMDAGLAFAQCGRDHGYVWVADPAPESSGDVIIPTTVSEEEMGTLFDDCFVGSNEEYGLMIMFETGIVCYGTPVIQAFGGNLTRDSLLQGLRQARAGVDHEGNDASAPFAPRD